MTSEAIVWALLAWVVLPLWLAAGVLDYACHARQHSVLCTGRVEAWLHLLQSSQIGAGVLLVLFLHPTWPWLWTCVALVVVHTATAWVDLRYAAARRPIGAAEQFAHAFLIVMPVAATLLLALLPQDGGWRWRDPVPWGAAAAVIVAGLVASWLPAVREVLAAGRVAPSQRGAARDPRRSAVPATSPEANAR